MGLNPFGKLHNCKQTTNFTKNMKTKKVQCDVRGGNLISQQEPHIPGVVWKELPDTRIEIGNYFQYISEADIPLKYLSQLPDHCYVLS